MSFKDQRPHRRDDGAAFLPNPQNGGPSRAHDDLAESLAEEFVASATSGEESHEPLHDDIAPEEIGGPFVEEVAANAEEDRDEEELERAEDAVMDTLEAAPTAAPSLSPHR